MIATFESPLPRPAASRLLLVVLSLGGVAAMLLAVDPRAVAAAATRIDGGALVAVGLLGVVYYALQGLRWHLLLRQAGARVRVRDSQLVNIAGQAVTAVLPLGDLTRALLATRISGVSFGATAATVTVQELTYTLLVVVAAAPGLTRLPGGPFLMALVVAGIAAVVTVLTVRPVFAATRRLAAATPGLRRFVTEIDALHREVRHLLGRPAVLAGAVLDLGRVIAATAAFLLILRGLHIASVDWWGAALVLATSFVGGALSLLPGGIGANEAGVVGVLVLLGVNPAAAAAAAIIQRVSLVAVPAVGGAAAYLVLRRSRTLGHAGAGLAGREHCARPIALAPRFTT